MSVSLLRTSEIAFLLLMRTDTEACFPPLLPAINAGLMHIGLSICNSHIETIR